LSGGAVLPLRLVYTVPGPGIAPESAPGDNPGADPLRFMAYFVLLRREGWRDNHKRVHRLYKEEGLNLRTKRSRRNKAAAHRVLSTNQECWSMDFVADQPFNGRKFRCLTIVDKL